MRLQTILWTVLSVTVCCDAFHHHHHHQPGSTTTGTSFQPSLQRRRSTPHPHAYAHEVATTRLPILSRLQASNSGGGGYDYSAARTTATKTQNRDVVIIGGGLAGLSAALHLSQIDPDRHVTIYEREAPPDKQSDCSKTAVASFAAAGMLAPQSERLPKGSLLDLCLESRRMYPDFCALVEDLARTSGPEGQAYLPNDVENNKSNAGGLQPWQVGYMASGGFLAPAFAGDSVATWAPPDDGGSSMWLDEAQVRELEPNLHPSVVGGWWFPQDASVDARRLTWSLRAACVAAGVQIMSGDSYEVTSLDLADNACRGVWLKSGQYVRAKTTLVANGAWMRNLVPVPVVSHKGQSLSLRMPRDRPPMLRRVLFAQDTYIVPKADGRIVVGATVEAGSYDAEVTPAGIMHVIMHALELVPGLKDLPIEETWAGLRPTTPDKGPILGKTAWDNLLLAGGYWRNGVLLAPKTGQLLACLISGQELSKGDTALLDAFAWDRFVSREGGQAMTAQSRYAASMHPIHSRQSGAGVAASVGTELGSYSTARSAREERELDRSALFGADFDDLFEKAAAQGRTDAQSYIYEDDSGGGDESVDESVGSSLLLNASDLAFENDKNKVNGAVDSSSVNKEDFKIIKYEGSGDAITVGHSTSRANGASSEPSKDETSDSDTDMDSLYASIRANKAKQPLSLDEDADADDERPDPGFRIYHVDKETGNKREVPPYTTPEDFLQQVEAEKASRVFPGSSAVPMDGSISSDNDEEGSNTYSEQTYDGYVDIQEANSRKTREEELEAMRKARQQNRIGQEGVDELKIGAVPLISDLEEGPSTSAKSASFELPASSEASSPTIQATAGAMERRKNDSADMSDAYEKIRANKAENALQLDEKEDDERPDPGFRIYHVDKETGEKTVVPPYTPPEEFLRTLHRGKEKGSEDITQAVVDTEVDDQPTFDGYTDIQQSNGSSSREEELKAMKAARQQNRKEDTNEEFIGAVSVDS